MGAHKDVSEKLDLFVQFRCNIDLQRKCSVFISAMSKFGEGVLPVSSGWEAGGGETKQVELFVFVDEAPRCRALRAPSLRARLVVMDALTWLVVAAARA